MGSMPAFLKSRNPFRKLAESLRVIRDRHKERHQPTGFGFAFADRVDYLDSQRWDGLTTHGSVFLRREILRVIEEHGPENIVPRYAIIFRDNKAVAALVAQMVLVTGERLRSEKHAPRDKRSAQLVHRARTHLARAATAKVRERMLVAGNVFSWGFHGIAFAPDEDPAQLWPGVAEALYRIRRAERLTGQTNFVMVKDLTERQTGLEALSRFSYRPLKTEPNMVLEISPAWRSYDDYLAALDAKHRRNARDQLKKLASAGCVPEPLIDLSANARRLHELYLAVHSNAPIRLVTLRETYLPALASAAGENFRCTVARRGDDILG